MGSTTSDPRRRAKKGEEGRLIAKGLISTIVSERWRWPAVPLSVLQYDLPRATHFKELLGLVRYTFFRRLARGFYFSFCKEQQTPTDLLLWRSPPAALPLACMECIDVPTLIPGVPFANGEPLHLQFKTATPSGTESWCCQMSVKGGKGRPPLPYCGDVEGHPPFDELVVVRWEGFEVVGAWIFTWAMLIDVGIVRRSPSDPSQGQLRMTIAWYLTPPEYFRRYLSFV